MGCSSFFKEDLVFYLLKKPSLNPTTLDKFGWPMWFPLLKSIWLSRWKSIQYQGLGLQYKFYLVSNLPGKTEWCWVWGGLLDLGLYHLWYWMDLQIENKIDFNRGTTRTTQETEKSLPFISKNQHNKNHIINPMVIKISIGWI